ncbi:MAG: 3-hydroxyacyl-CoA dehydrogenase [Bacilli bacterium]
MEYKKIVVIGGGVLGSQIAFQSAYSGYDTTILIRKEDKKQKITKALETLKKTYIETLTEMTPKHNWARGLGDPKNFNREKQLEIAENTLEKITITTNQKEALEDADLVIESITENIEIKRNLYAQIANLLPEKTVIVTNSSTLLPSKLADYTKRPNKFLSMHFANSIWKNNIVEVMGHAKTEKKYFDEIIEFGKSIRMIPLPVTKEKSGYLLNSMLVPFLLSALDLYANGISDPQSIDDAWTLGTGAPHGPFKIMDVVGLETVKNIVEQYQKVPGIINPLLKKMMLPYNYKNMLNIVNKYISEGKLGKSTGEGFYKYED